MLWMVYRVYIIEIKKGKNIHYNMFAVKCIYMLGLNFFILKYLCK